VCFFLKKIKKKSSLEPARDDKKYEEGGWLEGQSEQPRKFEENNK
jgi:hypothetical protein